MAGDVAKGTWMLALESNRATNLCVEAKDIGFCSSKGVTPGRLLRLVHALTRAALLSFVGNQPTPFPLDYLAPIRFLSALRWSLADGTWSPGPDKKKHALTHPYPWMVLEAKTLRGLDV